MAAAALLMRRRGFIAGIAALLAVSVAKARAGISIPPAPQIALPPVGYHAVLSIDSGQSWRTNSFDSFANFGLTQAGDGYTYSLNPLQGLLLTPKVNRIPGTVSTPGPMPNSAGISGTQTVIGVTSYSSTDSVTIGRCSVMGQQYRLLQLGQTTILPEVQFCTGFPGSTWISGGGGGLGPGATFTGSITNDVLTVGNDLSGTVATGQLLEATGVTDSTYVLGFLTGTGGPGTYQLGIGQVIASTQMTTATGTFIATIGGAVPTNTMTISSMLSGSVSVGQAVNQFSILPNTKISSQIDGTPGGVGDYLLEVGSPQNVASESMFASGTSWRQMLSILPQIASTIVGQIVNGMRVDSFSYRWIPWTQGGDNRGAGQTLTDFANMTAAFDALNLPGTDTKPLQFLIGGDAAVSQQTDITPGAGYYNFLEIPQFVRANANGRTWGTTPWYMWPFAGPNEPSYGNIHIGPYGTARYGEFEGYVKAVIDGEGLGYFYPLWVSLTNQITVSGQVVTVPFDRPSGSGFASGVLGWMSTPEDGVKVWPNYGFNVRRNGTFLTPTPTISGMNVLLTVAETLSPGDVLEVTYSCYGPGGPSPGLCSGVGGNLMMAGPPSLMFPGKTVNAWAWQFLQNITV